MTIASIVLAFSCWLFFLKGVHNYVQQLKMNIEKTGSLDRKYHVIVWGSTGFTGSLVAKYLMKNYGSSFDTLNWAIGGRSYEKLQALQEELSEINSMGVKVPIIIADSKQKPTLLKMTAQAKVVISTVGPYVKHGTELVEACIETGTDYCDITGEPQFIKKNIERYHAFAQENAVKIVHCCGFDSVPSDLGVLVLSNAARKHFGAPLQEVTSYVTGVKGEASGGTVASVIQAFEETWKLGLKESSKLFGPYALNPTDNRPSHKESDGTFGYSRDINRWYSPFIMAAINAKVVRRSNALLGNAYGSDFRYREVQALQTGFIIGFFANLFTTIGLGLGAVLLYFPWSRALIKRVVPKPGTGPNQKSRDSGYFCFRMVGKLPAFSNKERGTRKLEAVVKSDHGDPGYKETSKMLAESALCMALDKERCPSLFGILTPASAMGMTLVERLKKADMIFEVEEPQKKVE